MKKITVGILFLLGALCFASFTFLPASEEQIIGEWLTSNQKAKIKIFKKNEMYYGSISWIKEPLKDGKPKLDINNPDTAKRGNQILGLMLLTGFKYVGDNEWEDGHIYDPEEGKTYSCHMELKDNGKTLHVRGYIGISILGRTDVWTRVQ